MKPSDLSFRASTLFALPLTLAACGTQVSHTPTQAAGGTLTAQAITTGAVYRLRSGCSDNVLDVAYASTANGAKAQIWSGGGGGQQQWRIDSLAGGYFKLTAMHSGKLLEVASSGTSDGTQVQQWPTNGTNAQQWKITDLGNGYAKLNPRVAPDKALDVNGASTTKSAKVQIWTDNGTCAQQWQLLPVNGTGSGTGGGVVSAGNPFAGAAFQPVGPDSNAGRAAAKYRDSDPARAAEFDKIASQPSADWFGDWTPDVRAAVDARTTQLRSAGKLPVYVLYNIPNRDNGNYSAGGAPNAASYRTWIAQVAAGLNGRLAAVILEPDAVPMLTNLSTTQRTERAALLRDAITQLSAAGARVYLDGGNANWHPAATTAALLSEAGIAGARGFSLNVSGFETTASSTSYGADVSARLGSKSFVIDTSRNGNGRYNAPGDTETWCNPPGRALGLNPKGAPNSAVPTLDAYYWIKTPGDSDGSCRGFPAAGTWVESYAYALAHNRP